MARTHEQVENWDFPAGTDYWNSIRAADAYLRVRLGLGQRCHVAVFDSRGYISEDTLSKAYREWENERNPLLSVLISYRDSTTEHLYAALHAQNLNNESDASFSRPLLSITVYGADAAEVRGVGLEAMDKAKRGVVVPIVDVPDIAPPTVVRPEPLPDLTERLTSERAASVHSAQPGRIHQVLNNSWVIGIGVTVIAGLVLAFGFGIGR